MAIALVTGGGCEGSSRRDAGAAAPGPVTITASAGAGGTVEPSGAVAVPHGAGQTFTIVAAAGFAIADVVVDGVSRGAVSEVTLADVTEPHTIVVTFSALPATAVVRLRTVGPLPPGTLIGGVQATLTHATDKGLSIQGGDVVAAGAATTGSLLVANATTAGEVIVALVNAQGFGAGEFACATFTVAPPRVLAPTDFAVAPGAQVVDLAGAAIPGVAVVAAPPDVL
jgi:hypothetical protein